MVSPSVGGVTVSPSFRIFLLVRFYRWFQLGESYRIKVSLSPKLLLSNFVCLLDSNPCQVYPSSVGIPVDRYVLCIARLLFHEVLRPQQRYPECSVAVLMLLLVVAPPVPEVVFLSLYHSVVVPQVAP